MSTRKGQGIMYSDLINAELPPLLAAPSHHDDYTGLGGSMADVATAADRAFASVMLADAFVSPADQVYMDDAELDDLVLAIHNDSVVDYAAGDMWDLDGDALVDEGDADTYDLDDAAVFA